MSKKSATKISILLFSIFSCLFLFSCADPNNNADDAPSKEELYKSIIGTWIYQKSDIVEASDVGRIYPNILITNESIEYIYDSGSYKRTTHLCSCENISTITDMKQVNDNSINPYNNYGPEKEQLLEILTLYPHYKNYDLCYYKICEYNTKMIGEFTLFTLKENKLYVLSANFRTAFDNWKYQESIYKFDKTSSENNSESSITASDLTGSYSISEANGSTFTFASDSTWTYKYNSRTTEGTWSVSDGKLTITYSLGGYSSSAIFSPSVSGDTYTLTGKSGDYVTIISSAFMITDQDAVANGVVTLIKQ